MDAPKTLEEVITYLEGLAERYIPLQSFGFGFADEQGAAGDTLYPQLFLEAEMEVTEINPGLNGYSTALLFLIKPDAQGTQPGTRAERAILTQTKQYADEVIEIIRMEDQLRTIKAGSWLSLSQYGNDDAYGWRVEVSFEASKNIDRVGIMSRLRVPGTVTEGLPYNLPFNL